MSETQDLLELGECPNKLPWGILNGGQVEQSFELISVDDPELRKARRVWGDRDKVQSLTARDDFLKIVIKKLGSMTDRKDIAAAISDMAVSDADFVLFKMMSAIDEKQEVRIDCPIKGGEALVNFNLNKGIHVVYPSDPSERTVTIPLLRESAGGQTVECFFDYVVGDTKCQAQTVTIAKFITLEEHRSVITKCGSGNLCDEVDFTTASMVKGFGEPLTGEYAERYPDIEPAERPMVPILPVFFERMSYRLSRDLNSILMPHKQADVLLKQFHYNCGVCGGEHEGLYGYDDILPFFVMG